METVRSLAATETLLVALDFDGTVSFLGDDPLATRAVPEASEAIATLARLENTHVAYLSGRSMRDLSIVTERPPVSPILYVGSHGAEYLLPTEFGEAPQLSDAPPEAAEVVREAQQLVHDLPGVWIEEKTTGLALHTRTAQDKRHVGQARRLLADLMAAHSHWRRRTGHDVVEYSWRAEGKDDALERLREITGASAVLFAGDDVTDEDAMQTLRPGDLGIRVGQGETAASLRVADPDELGRVLRVIASMRAEFAQ